MKARFFNYLICGLGLFLVAIAFWIHKFFGVVSIDQIVTTFRFNADGVMTSDPVFIQRFIKWCILIPLVMTLVFIFAAHRYRVLAKLPVVIFLLGLSYVGYQCSLTDFIRQFVHFQNDYFGQHYVDPHNITFTNKHPKNLIVIYVESLEATYRDKNNFGSNLLQSLDQVPNATRFTYYRQMPGTGWTVAALISTQCAIPLKSLTIFKNNNQNQLLSRFLPNAKCLGDVLADHGYKNIYMNGSSVEFAGIGTFLKEHHYTDVEGKENWIAAGYPEKEMSAWGLHDDELFQAAKVKLKSLMQKHERFNLNILTIDTHGPEGHLSKTCRKQGERDFPGIVKCTSDLVADFIHYVSAEGWLDQVTIVVVGDHLAMENPVINKLQHESRRSIFNMIVTDKPMIKQRDTIVHFDMLPTMLSAIGFQFQDGRVGLGYSGFAGSGANPPPRRLSQLRHQVNNYSKIYNQLW